MPPTKRTPPGPINDLRKLQLARLERSRPGDYARVLATLNAADRAAVLADVAARKGKPLPPMPKPGKIKFSQPSKKLGALD